MRRKVSVTVMFLSIVLLFSCIRGKEDTKVRAAASDALQGTFVISGDKLVTDGKIRGELHGVTGKKLGDVLSSMLLDEENLFITIDEEEDEVHSAISRHETRCSVTVSSSYFHHEHSGILICRGDGTYDEIEVMGVLDDFLAGSYVDIVIATPSGSYSFPGIDTSSLAGLLYDTDGYRGMIEDVVRLEREGSYGAALEKLMDFRSADSATFSYCGGDIRITECREMMYQNGVSYFREKKYEEAIAALRECGLDYKDADVYVNNALHCLTGPYIIGDEIEFGRKPDGTPLKWIIVFGNEGKALLLSSEILFKAPFSSRESSVWKESSIRKYLNDTSSDGFLGTYFTPEERKIILTSAVSNPSDGLYEVTGSADTLDCVFLLSMEEVRKYSSSSSGRTASLEGKPSQWWLRTNGSDPSFAAVVSSTGLINAGGCSVTSECGVRPAIWVSIYGYDY